MPYTQEEAQKLTFYTNFRDDLREEYLVKVKESSDLSTPFRDDKPTQYLETTNKSNLATANKQNLATTNI